MLLAKSPLTFAIDLHVNASGGRGQQAKANEGIAQQHGDGWGATGDPRGRVVRMVKGLAGRPSSLPSSLKTVVVAVARGSLLEGTTGRQTDW